jgi:hypothetical protein
MQDTPANLPERLSFNEAVAYVRQTGKAAFAAMPVFGDDNDENATAEGARVFLLLPDDDEGWILRFIAGPFFSSAYAANDVIAPDEIPDRVRELLFMPTRCAEEWLTDQLQVLLGKLTQAAGIGEQMPDYEKMPAKGAGPEAVFPVNFIGGLKKPH